MPTYGNIPCKIITIPTGCQRLVGFLSPQTVISSGHLGWGNGLKT